MTPTRQKCSNCDRFILSPNSPQGAPGTKLPPDQAAGLA
jgi:hypothetical protein